MGWFGEYIEKKTAVEDEALLDAKLQLEEAVTGKFVMIDSTYEKERLARVIDQIFRFFKIRMMGATWESFEKLTLDQFLRQNRIVKREITLEEDWYTHMYAPLAAVTKSGIPVALIPKPTKGYYYMDPDTGKRREVNRTTSSMLQSTATVFYREFPDGKLKPKDVLAFAHMGFSTADFARVFAFTFLATLLGVITQNFSKSMMSSLASIQIPILALFFICLLMAAILTMVVNILKNGLLIRISTKVSKPLQASFMLRLLSMPVSFVRTLSAGDVGVRIVKINNLIRSLINIGLSLGLTAAFSLLYIKQIGSFAPALLPAAVLVLIVIVLIYIASGVAQYYVSRDKLEYSSEEAGIAYSIIEGIKKIIVSGAQKRAFVKWAKYYTPSAKLSYNPSLFLKIYLPIIGFVQGIGLILLYFTAYKNKIEVGEFYGFTLAYGMMIGTFQTLFSEFTEFVKQLPAFNLLSPLLMEAPEERQGKFVVNGLKGDIELKNVSFGYSDSQRNIIENLSVKIRPGEYVAVVGETGCGKSTLINLLLGFVKPSKGEILYDGQLMAMMDIKSLRTRIGTVLQNGMLLSGDIKSNISINNPSMSDEEIWEAAKVAGIADDIAKMPMKMNTVIAQGGSGLSGGQKQKIMIARAIAPKPQILIFDEATSALDNVVQKQISDALDAMNCTRIVVAHRLSTIRNCDRILVLDGGKIAEDGNYEELLARGGLFTELVKRQIL